MAEFLGVLIGILISGFAIILGLVLLLGALFVFISRAIQIPGEGGINDWSWPKALGVTTLLLMALAVEVAVAISLGVFRSDASLHCGPGTAYHYAPKGHWTCELQ